MTTVVYSSGLVCCSVCTDLTDPDEIAAETNRLHPTGIASPWRVSDDATFMGGQPNPSPCEQDRSRQHFLMVC